MMVDPVRSNALSLIRGSLDAGSVVRLRIDGESMRPTLRLGDFVTVRRQPAEHFRIGDIIVLQRKEDLVTHRLVAIQSGGWYTKGDASSSLDPLFTTDLILGRVEKIERGNRSWRTDSRGWTFCNRLFGWLAWEEARTYQWYGRLSLNRNHTIKWWARIFILPFRLPVWLLAALRR